MCPSHSRVRHNLKRRRHLIRNPHQAAEPVVTDDQDGEIWQAEEAQETGEWKRDYGFVGRHIIARVHAREIEFPKPPEAATPPK